MAVLLKSLRQTPLSTEVDENGNWKIPFGVKSMTRKYTPADIAWLKRHYRIMPVESLLEWWKRRTKHNWSSQGLREVLIRHGIRKTKNKGSHRHLVICLKDFV